MEAEETTAESVLARDRDPADAPAAVGYVRLSQESDRSLNAQKAAIRDYCAEHGLDLVGILSDGERTSGFDADRAKYQELRRLVAEQAVDAVVVRDLSRLSRNRNDRVRLLLDLDESPVDLHSVERGLVESGEYDLAIEAVRATADDVEKRKEIERAKAETRRRVDQGYYQGRPPFGLRFDDAGEYLVPDPEEFHVAQAILDRRDRGESYREIAAALDVSKDVVAGVLDRREKYERGAG